MLKGCRASLLGRQLSPCGVLDDLLRGFHDFWSICNSLTLFIAVFVTVYVLLSVVFGTYMRLDLLLGFARGCPGSTGISLGGSLSHLSTVHSGAKDRCGSQHQPGWLEYMYLHQL